MIASISGIRGIPNSDISLIDFARFTSNFAGFTGSDVFLVARDPRSTGETIKKAISGALLSRGAEVVDFGVISTPALFRESRTRRRPGVMVTASHNEPEFNGLKFIVDGLGAGEEVLDAVLAPAERRQVGFAKGTLKWQPKASYNDDLVRRFGEGSCEGVKVALDLGGGAAISHAVPVLKRLGCDIISINDSYGVFNRRIDPTEDELTVLQKMVKAGECIVGLGFDCDGDRLVIVDSDGRKRTGDYMLTLAISRALAESKRKDAVVSVDTTLAVDEVVGKLGGKVFRSKVGEASVVGLMREEEVWVGGEGSSGGLIDGAFNYCRDSMLAALMIIKALKDRGPGFYDEVRSYQQRRAVLKLPRQKALKAIRALAARHRDADMTDGVKIWLSHRSWVLVRPSNTEDVVRVSAEAETADKAAQIVASYSARIRELSR